MQVITWLLALQRREVPLWLCLARVRLQPPPHIGMLPALHPCELLTFSGVDVFNSEFLCNYYTIHTTSAAGSDIAVAAMTTMDNTKTANTTAPTTRWP